MVKYSEISVTIKELNITIVVLIGDKRRLEADLARAGRGDQGPPLVRRLRRPAPGRIHRLADELKRIEENYKNADELRKQLEASLREVTVRLEDVENTSKRESKRLLSKFQTRVSILFGITS